MLQSWRSWSGEMTFLPLHARVWDWLLIAALPLLIALFRPLKSLIPVAAALALALTLPWCSHQWTSHLDVGNFHRTIVNTEQNLFAYGLVAAFTVFLIGWGVRLSSKVLVNYGVVGFAITVGWFYFSNLFDKMGRSLGLIGLGVLFLAGGWALEKTRRGLLSRMGKPEDAAAGTQEAL